MCPEAIVGGRPVVAPDWDVVRASRKRYRRKVRRKRAMERLGRLRDEFGCPECRALPPSPEVSWAEIAKSDGVETDLCPACFILKTLTAEH